jgi:hypothetical protein
VGGTHCVPAGSEMPPELVEFAIKDALSYLGRRLVYYKIHLSDAEVALSWCHFRETNRSALVSLARGGWHTAHAILCEMALFLTEVGDPLPLWLQEYVVFSAADGEAKGSKRGQNALTNVARDMAIAMATDFITEMYKLRPTRSTATNTECGCSIVAKALEGLSIYMSEANVAAIWQRQRRRGWVEGHRLGKKLLASGIGKRGTVGLFNGESGGSGSELS